MTSRPELEYLSCSSCLRTKYCLVIYHKGVKILCCEFCLRRLQKDFILGLRTLQIESKEKNNG